MATTGTRSGMITVAFVMIVACLLVGNSEAKHIRRNTQRSAWVKCSQTDRAVFSAVLNAKFPDNSKTCVVQSDTIGDRMWHTKKIGDTPEHRKGLEPLLVDLNRRNGRSCVISRLQTSCKVHLVGSGEIQRIFKHGFWQAFYKKFPESAGLIVFSLPGYSRDKDAAIVYFAHSIGGEAGYGSMIFLKRVDGRWKVECEQLLRIS